MERVSKSTWYKNRRKEDDEEILQRHYKKGKSTPLYNDPVNCLQSVLESVKYSRQPSTEEISNVLVHLVAKVSPN